MLSEQESTPRNEIKRTRRALNKLSTIGFRDFTKALSLISEAMSSWGATAGEVAS